MEEVESPRKKRKLSHDVVAGAEVDADQNEPLISNDRKLQNEIINGADSSSDHVSEDEETDFAHQPNGNITRTMKNDGDAKPMSKNQLKKLRKKQEWEAGREYRKAKRKEKTAERKARKRTAREEEEAKQKEHGAMPHPLRPPRPTRLPITFIIDCGFDHLMSEKERISLGSQLTRAYSDNSRAQFQAHLVVSSWNGALKDRFDTVLSKHYENWRGIRFVEGDFVEAAKTAKESMGGTRGGKLAGVFEKYASGGPTTGDSLAARTAADGAIRTEAGQQITLPEVTNVPSQQSDTRAEQISGSHSHKKLAQPLPESETIYLTSDSPNTLEELNPYSTYVIGGLVDKNRHKGVCYKIACDMGINTAKLPIGTYMDMQSRSVLATNHVVEIMIRWLECGDWGEAFMKVIPKRKGGTLKTETVARNTQSLEGEVSDNSAEEAHYP